MQFEWDPAKASANSRKHEVSFEEAQTVFYDDFAVQFFDDEHSTQEDRFIMLGMSSSARLLIVVHAEHADGDVVRIISARKATRNEAKFYRGSSHEG
ncbi:MAG: BrnT family toxin [Rubrivivax sp.]